MIKGMVAIVLFFAVVSSAATAHPGGLNAQGCHNDRKHGGYHCHGAQQTATPQGAAGITSGVSGTTVTAGLIKKSKSGICHAPGTSYYANTKSFTPFTSIEECIASGGRLPAR
jgi:hypothetical protein